MRSPLFLVSICLIAVAAAATESNAQTLPEGWQLMPPSSTPGERIFLDLGGPLGTMVAVRESGRSRIDAPSLGEWLTVMARADVPPGGRTWSEPGALTRADATQAMFTRLFATSRGVQGMAIYGAATGDAKQGRIVRVVFGTKELSEGPRSHMARALFMDLMMAEIAAGQRAQPAASGSAKLNNSPVPVPAATRRP